MALKNLKNKLVTAGLVVTALASTKVAANTTNDHDNASQAQWEAVMQLAQNNPELLQHEFAKHLEFPPFLPVTKDGQFDESLAKEYVRSMQIDKNWRHICTYYKDLKKGESFEKAYGTFVKNVCKEDQAREDKMMAFGSVFQKALQDKKPYGYNDDFYVGMGLWVGLMGTVLGLTSLPSLNRDENKSAYAILGISMPMLLASLGFFTVSILDNKGALKTEDLEVRIVQVQKSMYDRYVMVSLQQHIQNLYKKTHTNGSSESMIIKDAKKPNDKPTSYKNVFSPIGQVSDHRPRVSHRRQDSQRH